MRNRFILLNFVIMAIFGLMASGCKSHKEVTANPIDAQFQTGEVWVLSAMNGRKVKYLEGQPTATVAFNPEAGTLNGRNGCNKYFGGFKDLGEGRMILSDISSTKMACPEAFHKLESTFMQLLRKCDGYNLGAYSLELLQGDKVLLSFDKEQ